MWKRVMIAIIIFQRVFEPQTGGQPMRNSLGPAALEVWKPASSDAGY